jgi:hypothetical protein
MKANKILIASIIILLAVAVFVYIQKKKKTPTQNVFDKILGALGVKTNKSVVETSKGYDVTSSPDYKFFTDLHFGDLYLSQFSQADLATTRYYIENYTRKGIKIQPSDPLYKDIVRINSYAKMFNDLPTVV